MRQKGYFILAILFALLAAGAVFLYLQQIEEEVRDDLQYATVPVVGGQIPAHTRITADMLVYADIPLSQVRDDALQRKEDISGAVATVPFYPGEPLIRDKLIFPGETHGGIAYLIAPGKRAMAMAVDEVIAVGSMLLPGDRVDVAAVLERETEAGQLSFATIFVQDLRVLAVGQSLGSEGRTAESALTVTLELSPDEAQRLVLAAERGSIRLLLRGAGDTGRSNLSPFTMDRYLNLPAPPANQAAPQPAGR
ncbi:MAG TPA: Flp pilus assembly protein CpaB [Firmicutes bacterium]|nr:Flp pilus assembly protein CpaB [Bacillota bacterium]